MKGIIRLFLSDNLIKISMIASIGLIVFQSVLMFLFSSGLPPYVPFLNSQPWGEERLFPSYILYFTPLLLLSIFLINNLISARLYKKNTLISRILSFNSLLFIFLGLMAYVQIIFLVY